MKGLPVDGADIATLPPICKTILIEHPGLHWTMASQRAHPEIFERPENDMVKGNFHLHHYCWALITKQRYLRAKSKDERNFRFSLFMEDTDYVLKNSGKHWQYFHIILLEQAAMMQLQGDNQGSLAKADEALKYKPDFEYAYFFKFKVYMAMGEKNKAIEVAQEGLVKNPQAKFLRKRLESMGIPIPAPVNPMPDTAQGTPLPQAADDTAPPAQANDAAPPNNTAANAGSTERDEPAASAVSPPKSNPYCRFCP